MRFLSNLLTLLAVAGIFLLIIAAILVIILASGLGIGWLLARIFGFSLFEGALLALVAGGVAAGAALVMRGGNERFSPAMSTSAGPDDDEEDGDYDHIPTTRFSEQGGRTFQSWCEYELSNAIYEAFQDQPKAVAFMNASQQQELAIRLAQSAVAVLKTKTVRSSSLHLTHTQIERHLKQAGQMPYDRAIMDLAVATVNDELLTNEQAYHHIIKLRLWDQTAEWWDEMDI